METTSISIELYACNVVIYYNIDSLNSIKTMSAGFIEFYTGKFTNGLRDSVIFSGNYLIKFSTKGN